MVEVIANSLEDTLIDGLSFKLAKTASYITNRRSCTFHPQGSNIYSSTNGTKLIKITISGNEWLDPSTFRIMYDLHNTDATAAHRLRPIGGPWSFFSRMRVLAGGQILEDIDMYNRVHEMFNIFSASDSRQNDFAEGFGNYWDNKQDNIHVDETWLRGIPPTTKQTVLFKPMSGILNQRKYIPIRFMPITIELSLVDDPLDPIVSNMNHVGFTDANTAKTWEILNVQAKCDLVTLDSGLNDSYIKLLEDGKKLTLNYNTFISQYQTITDQTDFSINISRSLTRLKSVFVSLWKNYATAPRSSIVASKIWNDFFSPGAWDSEGAEAGSGDYVTAFDPDLEFEFQMQIGSKLYPEYPIRSHAEAYYQLRKTLGHQSSTVHNFAITAGEYKATKFVIGIDTEKVLEAGFTGLNTRAGDLLTVKFKYARPRAGGNVDAHRIANLMHIVLHSDHIIEIHDTGVRVFD